LTSFYASIDPSNPHPALLPQGEKERDGAYFRAEVTALPWIDVVKADGNSVPSPLVGEGQDEGLLGGSDLIKSFWGAR
jgi:hypothetical protein